jgi:hypothetical protein
VICRGTMQGNNSHVHLTIDTQIQRDLSSIKYEACDYILDGATRTVTNLSNCSLSGKHVKLPANKILLRIGWGEVATQRYTDNGGRSHTKSLYISESAMRQLGFISFFDLCQE